MNKGGCEVVGDKTLCLKIAESPLPATAPTVPAFKDTVVASNDTVQCTGLKGQRTCGRFFLDTPPLLLLGQEGGGKGALRSNKVVIKCKTE